MNHQVCNTIRMLFREKNYMRKICNFPPRDLEDTFLNEEKQTRQKPADSIFKILQKTKFLFVTTNAICNNSLIVWSFTLKSLVKLWSTCLHSPQNTGAPSFTTDTITLNKNLFICCIYLDFASRYLSLPVWYTQYRIIQNIYAQNTISDSDDHTNKLFLYSYTSKLPVLKAPKFHKPQTYRKALLTHEYITLILEIMRNLKTMNVFVVPLGIQGFVILLYFQLYTMYTNI